MPRPRAPRMPMPLLVGRRTQVRNNRRMMPRRPEASAENLKMPRPRSRRSFWRVAVAAEIVTRRGVSGRCKNSGRRLQGGLARISSSSGARSPSPGALAPFRPSPQERASTSSRSSCCGSRHVAWEMHWNVTRISMGGWSSGIAENLWFEAARIGRLPSTVPGGTLCGLCWIRACFWSPTTGVRGTISGSQVCIARRTEGQHGGMHDHRICLAMASTTASSLSCG
mmetsp:Transcript_85732/g.276681  ORF Transcript_85732/g.276681 Transcript_85732/m.276681 type:complete len:225 (+) Transcript_85732:389-1063(+)